MKKFVAEFIGTCVLVTLGCGTAMLTGCEHWGGYLATALAFGLVIVGMAYCVGNISGCHINPAVSLAVFINGGITLKDFVGYICAQCLGALAGAGLLAAIFGLGGIDDLTGGFGSNGLAGVGGSVFAGLLVEVVLTFIFVLTILGVTSKKANHGSFGREPGKKYRTCYHGSNRWKYGAHHLRMGIHFRTLGRCYHRGVCI